MKKWIAGLLALVMCLGLNAAFAEAGCAHHGHTADCGGQLNNCTYACEACAAEIQALVDVLPDYTKITEANKAAVARQLTAVDQRKASASDATLGLVDTLKYEIAAFMLQSPQDFFGFAIVKRYEAADYTPQATISFVDESGATATLYALDGAQATSAQPESNGSGVFYMLPAGTYRVEEVVDGDWNMTLTVNGEQDFDAVFTGKAGEFYALQLANALPTYSIKWIVGEREYESDHLKMFDPITPPEKPTKKANGCTTYTFAGWSQEENGTVLEKYPSVTDNMTFYAVFTEEVKHALECNYIGDKKHVVECVNEGCDYEEEAVGCDIDPSTHICRDCKQSEICTITFMDGDKKHASNTYAYGSEIRTAGMPPVSIPQGYQWDGWYTADGLKLEEGMVATGDMVFYARIKLAPANEPPVITRQPADQQVTQGQSAEFSVEAAGDGLTYQWYIDRNDGLGWKEIDGAVGAAYATSAADVDCDGYRYQCLITDQHGNSIKSDAAVLRVCADPALPETGDDSAPVLWLAMVALSMAGIVLLRRKAYGR